jgi:hypothetical protein
LPSVVTGNLLRTGAVVYLAADERWVPDLEAAEVAADKAELARLEEIAQRAVAAQEVTAVYAMDVGLVDGRPIPLSVREKIRASRGPTVGEGRASEAPA